MPTAPAAPAATAGSARARLAAQFAADSVPVLTAACTRTLPAVASTIGAIIQATEVAAQKVLDEADALVAERNRLCTALAALDPFVAKAEPAAQAACLAVIAGIRGVSARVAPIVGAMEFQDLTAQHLRAAIDAVQSLRRELVTLLSFLEVPVATEAAPVKVTTRIGAPAASSPWRQALADRLLGAAPSPTAPTGAE